jgi:hypothetical protein
MVTVALILLILLQIKHWYIDFVDQDMVEVKHKGIYGHWLGIRHSLKQGIGTAACVAIVVGPAYWAASIFTGVVDALFHYHIDWAKMNWGNRDMQNPSFWAHLGLDQMAHQLTYIGLVAIITL